MKHYEAKITGMTCVSCEHAISKAVSKIDGVQIEQISASEGRLLFKAKEDKLEEVKSAIRDAGYKVADCCQTESGMGRMGADEKGAEDISEIVTVKEVIYGILDDKAEWKAERRLLINSVGSLAVLLVLLAVMYFGLWQGVAGFTENRLPLLIIGAVSVVSIVAAGYHFAAYHKPISCSLGMMEGMTFGMMTGFLVGALLGATNGMFWGSVLSMIIGCIAGAWAGRLSGVMGIMEGLMAGVMSGTMGAMLSVMLLASPLIAFLWLLTFFCVLILAALAYMQIKELGRLGRSIEVESLSSMASTCFIFFVILTLIMIYGPVMGPVFGG